MKESLYQISRTRLTRLKNTGYDYKNKIFEKSLSPYILRDDNRKDILSQYEKIVYFLIEKAKYVKNFFNYTVDKNYKQLN